MFKRGFVFIALTAFVLASTAFVVDVQSVQADDKVYKWKCQGHWPMASTSFAGSGKAVVELVKKRSKGRLDIELFAAGSLVPPKEIFNAVKRGMVPIGVTSSAYPRSQVPLFNVTSGLPLNFKHTWEAGYFHQIMGFEQMMVDACAKHGIFCSSDRIYSTELALKKPVSKFADFKGLKLRSSGITQVYLSSIGAAASYIPGSEIYAALASGVVEGAHWGAVQGNNSLKFYDVCKYHLLTPFNYAAGDVWLVNQKALAKLPADLQKILLSTLKEHFWRRTNEYLYKEATALADVQKKHGVKVTEIPAGDYNKMLKEAVKVWDDVAKKNPDCAKAVQMLKDFNKSLGRL
ncbi:MAG: TRAP transporter substrate-binding protein DctP [Desulfarculaceae bacterium]|jgi:TRAP-type mannitol/chloroaromatic compound transport system substrate-binding protein